MFLRNLKQSTKFCCISVTIYFLCKENICKENMASRYEDNMKTKLYLPFDMGGRLTETLIAKAREELGETEEVKAKTIPELRKLVQAEAGLSCPTDDAYLIQYLRARKYNVQKAFSLLKNFYEMTKSNADIFGYDQDMIRRMFVPKVGFMLPYRDEDGCVIAVVKMRRWDLNVTSASEAIFAMAAIALWVSQEPASQICGIRMLVDVRGSSLKQIRTLIPRHVCLLAKAFTNSLPLRFKGIHIYNESRIFPPIVSFLKLFMTEKMKNRVHLHGNSQKHLHKFIPKAILPAEDFIGDNPNDVSVWFNPELEKCSEIVRQFTIYGYSQ